MGLFVPHAIGLTLENGPTGIQAFRNGIDAALTKVYAFDDHEQEHPKIYQGLFQ